MTGFSDPDYSDMLRKRQAKKFLFTMALIFHANRQFAFTQAGSWRFRR